MGWLRALMIEGTGAVIGGLFGGIPGAIIGTVAGATAAAIEHGAKPGDTVKCGEYEITITKEMVDAVMSDAKDKSPGSRGNSANWDQGSVSTSDPGYWSGDHW